MRERLMRALSPARVRAGAGLAARFLAARILSGAALLMAAGLLDITAFATFGVYLALINLIWVGIFLRYEGAIVGAAAGTEAESAMRLCAGLAGSITILAALGGAAAAGAGAVPVWLAAIFPVAIAARATMRLAVASATRSGDFLALGRVALVQSVVQPVLLIGLALAEIDGTLCFALADAAGHGAAAAYIAASQRRPLARAMGSTWSRRDLAATAWSWRSLPAFNLPGSFLALGFVLSPLMIVPAVASPVLAGHVALAMRLFDIPTQIIAATGSAMLMNHVGPGENGGHSFGRLHGVRLIVAVSCFYGILALSLIIVDPWLQGSFLSGLAHVAPLVAAFQAAAAAAAPIGEACGIFREQHRLTLIHAAAVAGALLVFALSMQLGPYAALLGLGGIGFGRALALGERLHRLTRPPRHLGTC